MEPIPQLHESGRPPPRNLRPHLFRFASFLHVLVHLIFVLSIIITPILFISHPQNAPNFLLIPALVITLGAAWLLSASRIRCRVCSMRMLIHQPCSKHSKAPSWPLLGCHTTLAIQALYSRRVRCPYCGTPNQLSAPPEERMS